MRPSHLVLTLLLALLSRPALAATPLYYCNDPDWAPLDYVDSMKKPRGVAPDTLQWLIRHRLRQYQLIYWPTQTWEQSLVALRKNKCQVLPEAVLTENRQRWMAFTRPYASYPLIFVTRKGAPTIKSLDALRGKTLARQRGSVALELLKKRIPHLSVLETPDRSSAYLAVANGKADFTLDPAPVARAKLNMLGLGDQLEFNSPSGLHYELRMAVNKAHSQLAKELDAALASMPFSVFSEIESRYITPEARLMQQPGLTLDPTSWQSWLNWFTHPQNRPLLIALAAVTLTALLIILRLRRKSQKAALDPLTGLPNRQTLETMLTRMLRRARPGKRPLSLIALDIDFFKRINDEHGHLTGDAVLKELAAVLKRQKREQDLVVRWGGEEFLFIAQGANLKQACGLAERLREAAQRHFMENTQLPLVTISLGVAEYQPGETAEQLIQRADTALYQSKHQGRNRVSCHRGEQTFMPAQPKPAPTPAAQDPLA